MTRDSQGNRANEPLAPCDLVAFYFAQTVVHAHGQLTPKGKRQLEGRLRDSLQLPTGFSSVYLEIDVARRLLDAGYEVEFTDMDGVGRYDLRFWRGTTEGEVECKTLSTDAGRKIHRHDFYRFIDAVSAALAARLEAPVHEIILITLDGRMPGDDRGQNELRSATRQLLLHPGVTTLRGSFFSILRDGADGRIGGVGMPATQEELYAKCRRAYGDNCHVSGGFVDNRCCLIVVRSQQEDDHSAPQLEALRKAASQFSGTRPAFIAVQYDDVTVADLVLPHLRRRAGLLSYHLFLKTGASHVVATYFSAYGGLVVAPNGIGVPAFGVPNPQSRFPVRPSDYSPFMERIPDEEFACLVGAPDPVRKHLAHPDRRSSAAQRSLM